MIGPTVLKCLNFTHSLTIIRLKKYNFENIFANEIFRTELWKQWVIDLQLAMYLAWLRNYIFKMCACPILSILLQLVPLYQEHWCLLKMVHSWVFISWAIWPMSVVISSNLSPGNSHSILNVNFQGWSWARKKINLSSLIIIRRYPMII